ncbi:hypothetical protein ACFSM5_21045 [Lacibacterium aquatile]|uniref:Uncharacterized protein n=1 Tax=Lacibacterium aquatile TaxID=1168082 RepID=A0ABW5DW98_9PROT
MPYISPDLVISPKDSWTLVQVLLDRGEDQAAYALGLWKDRPRIAFRWNGNNDSPIGNPQSRGLPTWTMLDEHLHLGVLQLLPLEKQAFAASFLGITEAPSVELKVRKHPSGRFYLLEKSAGQKAFSDVTSDGLFGADDPAKFYKAFGRRLASLSEKGTRVSLVRGEGED